jgi:DNA processing protein
MSLPGMNPIIHRPCARPLRRRPFCSWAGAAICSGTRQPSAAGTECAHYFARNRIIAALSQGTLVIEAAIRSGALITARLAAEFGKEVTAVPGSIHNPVAYGCHQLIREGTFLVEQPEEVRHILGCSLNSMPAETTATAHLSPKPVLDRSVPSQLNAQQQQVWQALGHDDVASTRSVCARD